MIHISYGCDFCTFSTCQPIYVSINGKEEIACPDCWRDLKKEYRIEKIYQKDRVKIRKLKKKRKKK